MILSTLCYIEQNEKYLMLHRVKKENDANRDKWIGIGGKFEDKESPEECMLREVKEETGLILNSYKLRCVVTFVSNKYETEYMYVFKSEIIDLNIWEGDKIFLRKLINNDKFFTLKLEYDGEKLVNYLLKEY